MNTTIFDADLIGRYDSDGPRYTSYPTAPQFRDDFQVTHYRTAALLSNIGRAPLSVYVHVPFCASPCFYCGCNRVITRDRSRAERYVAALCAEISMQAQLFDSVRTVEQLHFGGGTPTFLSLEQLAAIVAALRRSFTLGKSGPSEFSIEIDPRTVDRATIEGLAALGVNRISLGVQDFDSAVQEAVNRVQSVGQTREIVAAARDCGIQQISFDLIYGLPLQTRESFSRTLDQVCELRPSRIATYGYAHMPRRFPAQRQIQDADLPDAAERLGLLGLIIERLTQAGYVYIGMDHFALPDDGLSGALRQGTLQRNFQGYSSHADCDLIGLGVSAIGKVGDTYAQNARDLNDYYTLIEGGQLAIRRGLSLTADDRIRRAVIQQLMCTGRIRFADIEQAHGIRFPDYFANELRGLEPLRNDGLFRETAQGLEVTERGRLLVRNIAMGFDSYLRQNRPAPYSRLI